MVENSVRIRERTHEREELREGIRTEKESSGDRQTGSVLRHRSGSSCQLMAGPPNQEQVPKQRKPKQPAAVPAAEPRLRRGGAGRLRSQAAAAPAAAARFGLAVVVVVEVERVRERGRAELLLLGLRVPDCRGQQYMHFIRCHNVPSHSLDSHCNACQHLGLGANLWQCRLRLAGHTVSRGRRSLAGISRPQETPQ